MQHKRLLFSLFASFLLVSVPIDMYAMRRQEEKKEQNTHEISVDEFLKSDQQRTSHRIKRGGTKTDITVGELVEQHGQKGELEEAQDQLGASTDTVSFATETEQTETGDADDSFLNPSPKLSEKPTWQEAEQALARAKQTPAQQKPETEQSEQEDSLDEAPAELEKVVETTQFATPPLSPKEKHSAPTSPRDKVLNSPQSATNSSGDIIQLDGQPNDLMSFNPIPETPDELIALAENTDELPPGGLVDPTNEKEEKPTEKTQKPAQASIVPVANNAPGTDKDNHTNQPQQRVDNAAPVHIAVQQPEVQAAPAVQANLQPREEPQENPIVEGNVDNQDHNDSADENDDAEDDDDQAPAAQANLQPREEQDNLIVEDNADVQHDNRIANDVDAHVHNESADETDDVQDDNDEEIAAPDQDQNNENDNDDSESAQDPMQQEESSSDESSRDITIDTDETDLHRDNPIDSRKEQEIAPDEVLLDGITDSEEEIETPPAPLVEPKSFLQQCANGAWVAFNHPILGPLMMFAGSMGVKKILETVYRSPRLNKHQKTIDKKVVPLLAQAAFANILQKGYGAWHEHEQSHSTLVYMPCYAAIDLLGKGVLPVAQKFLRKTAVGKKLIKKGKRFYAKQTRKRKKQINVATKAYKVVQNAVLAHMLANILVGTPAATA